MPRLPPHLVLLSLLWLLPAPVAHAADRPVTPEEFRQISEVLRREGFTRWGGIEFEGGRFEVDGAIGADGRKYDLRLSGVDFSIQHRELND